MNRNISFQLLLLSVLVASTNNYRTELLPQKWTDAEALSQGEADIDDMFNKVLTNDDGRKQAIIQPFPIEELYFHNDEQEFSMYLNKMEGHSKFEFKILKLKTVLPEKRVKMELLLRNLNVEGHYEADRMAYNDYNSKASGFFWITLNNISANGLATLEIEKKTSFKVDKMRLLYKANSHKMQISQHDSSPRLSVFINSENFGKTVVKKIWLAVTYHLNIVVQNKINPVLKKKSLSQIIKSEKMRAKYEDETISNTDSANKFVDTLIEYARKVIIEKYNDRIKIPDMKEGFERKVLFINWKGQFVANRGTARGCHTVERVGNTTFASDNSSFMHFHGTLGFENINLNYDYYKATFMGIGPSGSVTVKLFPLDIYVHTHIDFTGRRVYLDDFKLMNVGDIEVQMVGWGWLLDFLASKVATWIVGLLRDKIVYDLQNKYDHHISEMLGNYDLDEILEGKMLR